VLFAADGGQLTDQLGIDALGGEDHPVKRAHEIAEI
jgi:hypothetical protein